MSIGTQQTLQRYAKPLFVSSATNDGDVPFSFRDWYSAYQGIIPGQEFKQYNEYLTEWYKSKAQNTTDPKIQLRLNYLTLLKQLQLFFTKEESENWYSKVDITNDKELLLAIPYFAKKLKDIALYYLQLRSNIKESRLKYNQVGTNSGTVQQIQKFILASYTQKPNTSVTLPASIWKDVPELSSVKDNINIQIEELYDTSSYFDISPTVSVSAYYDLNDPTLQEFLTTKGLTLTSTDWIYKLGVYPLSANYIETSGEDLTELSKQIAEKYLGESKYVSTTPLFSAKVDYYDISVNTGNNFLFWPTGVYRTKAKTNPRYNSVFINESGLSTGATPGSSIQLADTVFVKSTRGIEGAWFRKHLYDYKTAYMSAELDANTSTVFRFPFPGYGLSAEDIEWTGYDLATTSQFFFLTPTIQQSIENTYWSISSIPLSACKPLKINDTTLADNRAYPNEDYNRADKISVWSKPPAYTNSIYSGDVNESWLYKFKQTDISLSGNSVVVWPYEKIDTQISFPTYYPENFLSVCKPIPVSAVNFSKAIASNVLSGADIIYKLSNYKDTPDLAIECCWLSGASYLHTKSKILGVKQGELQFIAYPGTYTKFVWNGPNFTDINTVFKSIKHQPDCKFANINDSTYLDYDLCNCKQTLFTPFGHPGETFDDYNGFADFIIENNFDPQTLDLSNWKDSTSTSYTQSSAFGWFKTNSKIGWGDGQWYAGSSRTGNSFYLETGKAYVYYRTAVKKEDKNQIILPEYVVRHPYNSVNQIWIRGYKNENNEWISSDRPSTMMFYPGDILYYHRKSTTSYILSSMFEETVDIATNKGSIWTDVDFISIKKDKSFTLSYPSETYSNITVLNSATPSYPQYPQININNIVSVFQWSVSAPNQPLQYFRNKPTVTIVPTTVGVYTFAVTAVSASVVPPPVTVNTNGTFFYSNTGWYVFTNIPPVTAIPEKTLTTSLTTFTTPAPGYVLNTPLNGWNYTRGLPGIYASPESAGAKPFWAKTYLQKDQYTNYKGINSWGTPQRVVNKYNILTQPEISDIVLEVGNKVKYTRNNPVSLIWEQPINFIVTVDKNEWSALNVTTSSISNLQDQLNNYKNEVVVTPTSTTSFIKFQSFVDNEPVEIYYNALNSFSWTITAYPEIPETIYQTPSAIINIKTEQPWANLSNRLYPTVAAFPSFENLQGIDEIGGYFTPSNIGASIYLDKDYTVELNPSADALKGYFNISEKGYQVRGLTKENQITPYTNYTQNNIWLKEPIVTGPIAGTIKKTTFKKYQKFVPYQSGYESNSRLKVGLLNPQSRQSPWGGFEDSSWTDTQNKPQTFTGVVNVDAWAQSQVLKQAGLQIDNWTTDIFGNQYGLYKNLTNVGPFDRKFVPGEIWVRKNSQVVQPTNLSLKNVFDTYSNTNLINELTGIGIRKIDIFFDTLLVETSGAVILERINYDYENDNIFSIADEARYLSLTIPVSTNLTKEFANQNLSTFSFAKAGDTWFLPEQKQVLQSVCGIQNNILLPEIYLLDLNNQNFKKVFPALQEDKSSINSLSSLNIVSLDPPTLSYSSIKKEYLLTILGKNNSNRNIIVEIGIKNLPTLTISTITVYNPVTTPVEPPAITQNLKTDVFISNIDFVDALNFQCVSNDDLAIYEKVSGPDWINLSPTGLFTGTPPFNTTSYNTIFKVSNSTGPTYYSFKTNVYYTEILTIYYLYTEGYILSGGDDFILQEDNNRIIE